MNSDGLGGSVTQWIGGLKAGDEAAARALWHVYFDGLVRLAHKRLRDAPRAVADSEDVALSAFHCLCQQAAAGRFPDLENRDNLWRVLATIAAQKAVDQKRRELRVKRGGGKTRAAGDLGDDQSGLDLLAQVAGQEPRPELAAILDEQYRQLLARLDDDALRQIAVWKMEGESNDDIAQKLGCGLRTVERKLSVIRAVWLAETTT